jgi:hypothetical protein
MYSNSSSLVFGPWSVLNSGLIDGLDPCVLCLNFLFICFLVIQRYEKKELICIGTSFIFAVFITYLLIGLGLFSFLYRLKEFWVITKVINLSLGISAIVLSLFCIYDLYRSKEIGYAQKRVLQICNIIRHKLHTLTGLSYRKDGLSDISVNKNKSILKLFLVTFILGFFVSILEIGCTGQVYLPTITFVLKMTPNKLLSFGYLLLYNLLFVIPLLEMFLTTLLFLTSPRISQILNKYFLFIRLLLIVLSFSSGVFLLWEA